MITVEYKNINMSLYLKSETLLKDWVEEKLLWLAWMVKKWPLYGYYRERKDDGLFVFKLF